MNRAILGGTINSYGVRLSYSENSKPMLSCAMTLTKPGRDGSDYWTFAPVQIVGPQAEVLAETSSPGIIVCSKASWAGRKRRASYKSSH